MISQASLAKQHNPLRWWHAVAVLFLCLAANAGYAQQTRPTESQVKAAYLFNFSKFVRWPALPPHHDTLEICVLGKNPFVTVLEATVKGEAIDGKPVTAKTITTIQEEAGCYVLFVSVSEESRLPAILSAAKRSCTLTVSDIPHFVDRGGMIEFLNQEDRIRFEVNVNPINEAGLTVSSELLKVASKVVRKSGGGN